jgi:hypothetical protein
MASRLSAALLVASAVAFAVALTAVQMRLALPH